MCVEFKIYTNHFFLFLYTKIENETNFKFREYKEKDIYIYSSLQDQKA